MKKNILTQRLVVYQIIAFGILLLLVVGDDVFDFPHRLFGAPAEPIRWREMCIEGGYAIVLGVFTAYFTVRLLTRIKSLEGFLPICMHCKRIRVNDEWQRLERYLAEHSEAEFSHGLCPECAKKYYGDVPRQRKPGVKS